MGWKYLLLHRQALYLGKKIEIAGMDDDIEVRFVKSKVLVAASVIYNETESLYTGKSITKHFCFNNACASGQQFMNSFIIQFSKPVYYTAKVSKSFR